MPDRNRAVEPLQETEGPTEPTLLSNKLMCELRRRRERSQPPRPTVEDVLHAEGLLLTELDHEVMTDLVYAEWVLRVELGEAPSHDEYLMRFPMISERLEKQWGLEQGLADLSDQADWGLTIPPTVIPPSEDHATWQPSRLLDSIGKYKIISLLGSGGQGDVYRALHPELNRDVVIKLVRPRWQVDAGTIIAPLRKSQIQQVFEEGRLLAQLSHPNVAQVYDVGQSEGCPFLVMEYVQGGTLDQYQRVNRLDSKQIARLLAAVSRAVGAAHTKGILHRDIKPQNIVVREDGEPKLIDFGLAKLADVWHSNDQPPGVCGTLGFMAPEQARGDMGQIGPAADIFGLGAVLFYMLTGQPPYHGSSTLTGVNLYAILERAKRCEWDRTALDTPQIPKRLAAICARAMSPEPTARFATAIELAQSLEAFATRPSRLRQSATVVAVVLAGLGLAWLTRPNSTAPRNANPAAATASSPDEAHKIPQPAISAELRILVHRDSAIIELNDAVPLPTGDALSIESNIPAGLSVMLFAVNGAGQLQSVASIPRQPTARRWRYPEAAEATAPLTGAAGTECLLLIGQSAEAISLEQIKAAWGTTVEWPSLPPFTVLRLAGTDVIREQLGRDLGPPQSTGLTPADQITRTLKRFARQLEPQFSLLEGLAFSHVEPAK